METLRNCIETIKQIQTSDNYSLTEALRELPNVA